MKQGLIAVEGETDHLLIRDSAFLERSSLIKETTTTSNRWISANMDMLYIQTVGKQRLFPFCYRESKLFLLLRIFGGHGEWLRKKLRVGCNIM